MKQYYFFGFVILIRRLVLLIIVYSSNNTVVQSIMFIVIYSLYALLFKRLSPLKSNMVVIKGVVLDYNSFSLFDIYFIL